MPEFDSTTEYRPIPNYSGYFAGTDGSIWTIRRHNKNKPKRLNPKPNRYGYFQVALSFNNKEVGRHVHSLILETFVGPRPDGYVTRHLNNIKTDNRLENLEWSTQAVNLSDRFKFGTVRLGEDHGMSKLTEKDVLEIIGLLKDGMIFADISRKIGISKFAISCIASKRTWKHIDPNRPIFKAIKYVGERVNNSRLSESDVLNIKERYLHGETQKSIAKHYSVHPSVVSRIIGNKRWKHL